MPQQASTKIPMTPSMMSQAPDAHILSAMSYSSPIQPPRPPSSIDTVLKRKAGSSDDDSSPHQEYDGSFGPPVKKSKASESEKEQEKAKRSREASRRYRQRKKAILEEMQKQMADLKREKEKLLQERNAAHEAVKRLRMENVQLSKSQVDTAAQVEKERVALLEELKEMYERNADDSELLPSLNRILPYCCQIHELAQDILARFITRDAAKYLVGAGFFATEKAQVENPNRIEGLATMAKSIFAEIAEVTTEQKQRILHIVKGYYEQLSVIGEERRVLSDELSSLCSPNNEVEDVQASLQLMATIECLRRNMRAEADLAISTLQTMVTSLKPRQMSQFLLRVQFVHKSVQQLKNIWESVQQNPGWSPQPLPYPQLLQPRHLG